MRIKRKIIIITSILFAALIAWLSFSYYREYSNNVHMQIGKDTFRYKYWELFTGNKWKLYVNNYYTFYITPFEGYSKKEMREHLANGQLIKCLYDRENVRIYSIPLEQYKSKYEIIYTVDGSKFYSFSNDYEKYEEDTEVKQRLNQLYGKYPEKELKKEEAESWE